MPSLRSSVLVGAISVLGACVTPCPCAARPTAHGSVPELVSQTLEPIAAGADPDQVSPTTGVDEGEGSAFGFAFAGRGSDFYLYDFKQGSLKHVTPLSGRRRHVSSISCSDSPCDGAVGSDGTVYLISDHARSAGRFSLAVLPPSAAGWVHVPGIELPGFEEEGPRLVFGGTRLSVEDSVVYLHDGSPLNDGGTSIAIHARLLSPAERVHHPAGVAIVGMTLSHSANAGFVLIESGTIRAKLPFRGADYLGTDKSGRSYFIPIDDGPPFFIECYGPSGKLIARSRLPSGGATAELRGRGHELLTPDGTVVQLIPRADGVHINTWRLRQQRP